MALTEVAVAAEHGGVGMDADRPFVDLVRVLDALLRRLPPEVGAPALQMQAREAEVRRFASLTPRERQVLCALAAGQPAAEVAAGAIVSLATVRTQIGSVLSELGGNGGDLAVGGGRDGATIVPRA